MDQKPVLLQEQSVSRPVTKFKKGSILIIALWSLCLLASYAVFLSAGVRQKITLVKRLDERDKLHFIGEAGIMRAIIELQKESQKPYSGLNDSWSNNPSAFRGIKVGDGLYNVSYYCEDETQGAIGTKFGLTDEKSKINIDKVDANVMERLFQIVLGFDKIEAQQLAASIKDWRDEDSFLSIPLGSAEDSYYRSLTHSYEAKDAPFEVLDELLLVRYVTPDIFNRLRDFITIYGDGRVNINTASVKILLSLGFSKRIVDAVIRYRKGEDGIIATEDDNILSDPSQIVPKLSQFEDFSSGEIAQLSAVRDRYLTTISDSFGVKSTAGFRSKKTTAQTMAVINRSGNILYWQEM